LVASLGSITLDSEEECTSITIDGSDALLDATATITIKPSSSTDTMYSTYSGSITVIADDDSILSSVWTVSDITEYSAVIGATSVNQDSVYFVYLAPTNIYNADWESFDDLASVFDGDIALPMDTYIAAIVFTGGTNDFTWDLPNELYAGTWYSYYVVGVGATGSVETNTNTTSNSTSNSTNSTSNSSSTDTSDDDYDVSMGTFQTSATIDNNI